MFLCTSCMECCGYPNCLRIPIVREESNERKDQGEGQGDSFSSLGAQTGAIKLAIT